MRPEPLMTSFMHVIMDMDGFSDWFGAVNTTAEFGSATSARNSRVMGSLSSYIRKSYGGIKITASVQYTTSSASGTVPK
jgi:hypothetical protein